jgi:hypothetical protein
VNSQWNIYLEIYAQKKTKRSTDCSKYNNIKHSTSNMTRNTNSGTFSLLHFEHDKKHEQWNLQSITLQTWQETRTVEPSVYYTSNMTRNTNSGTFSLLHFKHDKKHEQWNSQSITLRTWQETRTVEPSAYYTSNMMRNTNSGILSLLHFELNNRITRQRVV